MTNNEVITVKSPAAYDANVCLQLQNKAEEIYRLHSNKVRLTNHAVALFDEFQTKIKEGWSYEITKSSATVNEYGAISVVLIKPEQTQAEEIKDVRDKAKADYESRLVQEKEHQTQLLAEQQFQTYLRRKREAEQAEEDKMRAQFLADAQDCFSKIKTTDHKDKK